MIALYFERDIRECVRMSVIKRRTSVWHGMRLKLNATQHKVSSFYDLLYSAALHGE